MKKLLSLKNLIGIGLILFGLSLALTQVKIPDNKPIVVLDIEEPTTEVMSAVEPISTLITDPTDRAKLAIFNQEFSNRILNYSADNQQTNDVYVLAASYFFKDSLNDKYKDLDKELIKLLDSIIGSDNHVLSQEEKINISKHFLGLAWALVQKK
jgi:hypothetical protein